MCWRSCGVGIWLGRAWHSNICKVKNPSSVRQPISCMQGSNHIFWCESHETLSGQIVGGLKGLNEDLNACLLASCAEPAKYLLEWKLRTRIVINLTFHAHCIYFPCKAFRIREIERMCQNCYPLHTSPVLGAFAKFLQTTVTFAMPVCPHLTARLPLGGFSCNFVWWVSETRENSSFIKLWQDSWCFTLRLEYFHDISSNSSWNEKCIKQNLCGKSKHISVLFFFFSKILRDNVEECGRTRQAIDANKIRLRKYAIYMPDN
jgi:hypothetical protein